MRNVPTELVLLQIAEGLQNLAKNPDLSKNIANAYALSKSEETKLNDARTLIANAAQIKAEFEKRENALKVVDERIAQAINQETQNTNTLKLITQKKNELDAQGRKNDTDSAANEAEKERLADLAESLENQQEELRIAQSDVDKIKSDLKRRSDAVAQLVSSA